MAIKPTTLLEVGTRTQDSKNTEEVRTRIPNRSSSREFPPVTGKANAMKTLVVAAIAALLAVTAIDVAGGNHDAHVRMADATSEEEKEFIWKGFNTDEFIECYEGHGAKLDNVLRIGNKSNKTFITHLDKCIAACYAQLFGYFGPDFRKKTYEKSLINHYGEEGAKNFTNACQTQLDELNSTDFCDRGAVVLKCVVKSSVWESWGYE